MAKSDPELIGFKGGFAHDNSGYLIPGENGKVVEFSTSDFSPNNVNVIDFANLTGDASLVEFSGGFKDETHGYLIPETFNKVAQFDLATARIISSLDISVNGKDVSGFSGGFISGDYGYLVPNKSNELVRFSTNQNNIIINSDDKFTLDTFKSNDTITIDKNRAYNLRIDFSYLMAIDPDDDEPYEDVSMVLEIKPSSDISYFYNYDNSGSAGPGASEDISNVVRIKDLSYSEAFNFTFARKSDSDVSMLVTLRDNCNNDTAGNALSRLINFDVVANNVVDNFDATYDLALRDRDNLSFVNNEVDANGYITVNERIIYYNYLISNGIKLFDKVLIEPRLSVPLYIFVLYVFSEHKFTNAGKVGRYGPILSELRDAYSPGWTNNTNYLNVSDGIQEWTVPQTGVYEITAIGARGGNTSLSYGGYGASMQGQFVLINGTIIKILCGQMGYDNPISADPGGGGGTFVVIDDAAILVAGGGGGGATTQHITGAADADARDDGVEKNAYTGTRAGPDDDNGADNGEGGLQKYGASGAGFITNGPIGTWAAVSGGGLGGPGGWSEAMSFINGGAGGNSTHSTPNNVFGGFGGGAGAHGNTCIGGGAGGGYSGGTGADTQCRFGGGGSSFNNGTNPVNGMSVGTGHGYVNIKKL